MFVLGRIVYLFLILLKLPAGYQYVTHKLAPIRMKPPKSHQIFDIQTSTSSHCAYICLQNTKCLLIVYDEYRLLCKGYRTVNTIETVGNTLKAWKVLYKDESKNVATSLPITCTVSSQYSYSYQCSNARDGSVEPGVGHEWAARTNHVGEWIKLAFSSLVRLDELELWHRCAISDQARRLEIKFSKGGTLLAFGTCDGTKKYLDCKNQARFSRYTFSPARVTDWVKLTEVESCVQSQNHYFGFTEVKVIGRPVRK